MAAALDHPKRKQTVYTEEFRAMALAALAANEGNAYRTAKQLEIPEKTLRGWATGKNLVAPIAKQKARDTLASSLEKVAWRLLRSMNRKKIAAANAQQTMVACGIAIDKCRLLLGEAGSISRSEHVNLAALDVTKLRPDQLETLLSLLALASPTVPPTLPLVDASPSVDPLSLPAVVGESDSAGVVEQGQRVSGDDGTARDHVEGSGERGEVEPSARESSEGAGEPPLSTDADQNCRQHV